MLAKIRAARNIDMIGSEGSTFRNTRVTGSKNVVNIVGVRISHDRSLDVIECGISGNSTLSYDRITYLTPAYPVIVRADNFNDAAIFGIVIGNIYV